MWPPLHGRKEKRPSGDITVGAIEIAVPPNFAASGFGTAASWSPAHRDPARCRGAARPHLLETWRSRFGRRLGGDLRRAGWRRAHTVPGSLDARGAPTRPRRCLRGTAGTFA